MEEVTAEQLQTALDAREKAAFIAHIDNCKDFNLVFEFTIKCADLVGKTKFYAVLERDKLEDMMACGLRRMRMFCSHNEWSDRLGVNARKLKACISVIEEYRFSTNSEDILNSSLIGYLLWQCCPDIVYSRKFPRIKNFILDHHKEFSFAADGDSRRSKQHLENYFILLNFLIKSNPTKTPENYALNRHGVYANALFQCWRKIRSEARRNAAIMLHPRLQIPLAGRDIKWLIARMILQEGLDNARSVLLRSREINLFNDLRRYSLDYLLPIACADRNVYLVKYLLEQGANVKTCTVLTDVVKTGCAQIVDMLLKAGAVSADLNLLSVAVKERHAEVVCVLLEYGEDVNRTGTSDGETPLSMAVETNNIEVTRILLRKGATITPEIIHRAAMHGNIELVRIFLENGADVNGVDNRTGLTILSEAVFCGHTEVVRVLLKNGADVNKCNRDGFTSFHIAVLHGNIDIVRMLLENGANVNSGRFPPLYFMLLESVRDEKIEGRFNDPELIVSVIKLLLKYGARIDKVAKDIVKDKPEILALLEQTEKDRAEAKQAATTFMGTGFGKYKRGIFASEELKQLPPDAMRLIGKMIKASSSAAA